MLPIFHLSSLSIIPESKEKHKFTSKHINKVAEQPPIFWLSGCILQSNLLILGLVNSYWLYKITSNIFFFHSHLFVYLIWQPIHPLIPWSISACNFNRVQPGSDPSSQMAARCSQLHLHAKKKSIYIHISVTFCHYIWNYTPHFNFSQAEFYFFDKIYQLWNRIL